MARAPLVMVVGIALCAASAGCGELLGLEPDYYLVGAGGSGAAGGEGGSGAEGSGAGGLYADLVLADGPIGYWRFGEAPGATIAENEIPGGLSGAYGGGVALGVDGVFPDGAVELGDAEARVTFGDTLHFAGQSSFSIEVWARPVGLTTTSVRIVSKEVCCEQSDRNGYALSASDDDVLFQRIKDGGFETAASVAIPLGEYSHLVGTYDGENLEICLFINGSLADCTASDFALIETTMPLTAGNRSEANAAFDGSIDELAVYAKALSAEQVAAHYAARDGDSR